MDLLFVDVVRRSIAFVSGIRPKVAQFACPSDSRASGAVLSEFAILLVKPVCKGKKTNRTQFQFRILHLLTATVSSNFCRSIFSLVICSSCRVNRTPSERDEESLCFNSRSCRSQIVRNMLDSLMASLIFKLLDSISALIFSSCFNFKAKAV